MRTATRAGPAELHEEYLELLSRLKPLRRIRRQELRVILQEAHARQVRRGVVLYRQGNPATVAYVLVAGRMKVTYMDPDGSRIILHFVRPGEFLGGHVLVGIPQYVTSAEATHDSVVLAWDETTMSRLITEYPSMAVSIAELLANMSRDLIHRLAEIATLPVEQRLARAVLRLAQPTEGGKPSTLRISRQDLAELSGTTMYTVSRIISHWTRRKLVRGSRMRLIVTDEPRLSAIAMRVHHRTQATPP